MNSIPTQPGPEAGRGFGPASSTPGDFSADWRILVLVLMALIIGTGGALSAWVLIKLIAFATNIFWFARFSFETVSLAHAKPNAWMVAAPAVGGLLIGLMARYGSDKIRGHGIPEAIEAILIGGSRMSPKVAVLKPISSAISIGSGGPFGAEGPIIMTGGAIGSLYAQFFHLTAAERKTLLVAGASAGMTAIFGTPVAAVLLAVELLLFEWKPRSFIPVTAAVVVAAIWRIPLFGTGPLFAFAGAVSFAGWTPLICVGVGLVAGLQSALLTTMLYAAEDFFEHLPVHWMWWPAIGGLIVGVGGLFEPRALGVGYDVIGDLLAGHMVPREIVILLIVKTVIWIVALASGTSGGVLAPLLILGGALGAVEGMWLPGDDGFWALLGMAAMMGGTMRAPLTGALFAVELTGNVGSLLPLFAATGTAYGVTVLLLKRSILTEKIARRGQQIMREYSVNPFDLLSVGEMMVRNVETLPASMPVDAAVAFFTESEDRYRSYPVVEDNGRVVGMATRADVLRWVREGSHDDETLHDLISDNELLVGYPDEIVGKLADRMAIADAARVPIVDPATGKLVGLVARKDLLRIRAHSGALETDRRAYFGQRGGRVIRSG